MPAVRSRSFRRKKTRNKYHLANRVQLLKTQKTLSSLLNLNHSADSQNGKLLVVNIWHQYRIPTQLGYSVPAVDTKNFQKYWMQVGPKFEIDAMYDMMTENAQTKCPVVPRIFGSGYFQHNGEACLVMKHYGLNLSSCITMSKHDRQKKIDYVRRQLTKHKISFQEEDLTESNILYSKPKRNSQNDEGVTIIYLSCNDAGSDDETYTDDLKMPAEDKWLKLQRNMFRV